ncbi:MAG: ribonuclease HII [Chthoniobacterales bacterium]
MPCALDHERELWKNGISPVAGVDEAGRGPLAGPVTAAAVILPQNFTHSVLNDSKKLTHIQREKIYLELTSNEEIIWSVASCDHETIDRINILKATHKAIVQALATLSHPPLHVLVDGLSISILTTPQTAIVGGDAISLSIAAASVIAKVTRDRFMLEMDALYPAYGFAKHKGYATADHLANLRTHGPCPIHRRSFEPVAQRQLDLA